MKKLLVIFMTIFMVLGFVACTSDIYKIDPTTDNSVDINDSTDPGKDENKTSNKIPGDNWLDEGNYDTSWYYNTEPDEYGYFYYEITKPEELAGVAYLVNNGIDNFSGKTIYLFASIDLGEHLWTPIGYYDENEGFKNCFQGDFYGCNNVIKNLTITEIYNSVSGLFGATYNCDDLFGVALESVKIDVSSCESSTETSVGGFIGHAYGSNNINAIRVTGLDSYIKGLDCVGGIVGRVSATGEDNMTTTYILAEMNERIDEAVARKIKDMEEYEIEGYKERIAGYENDANELMPENVSSSVIIKDAYNNASISGRGIAGGIVGSSSSVYLRLSSCSNNGAVNVADSNTLIAGGILGKDGSAFTFYENVWNTNNVCIDLKEEDGKSEYRLFAGGVYGHNDSCPLVFLTQHYNFGKISINCPEGFSVNDSSSDERCMCAATSMYGGSTSSVLNMIIDLGSVGEFFFGKVEINGDDFTEMSGLQPIEGTFVQI